VNVTASSESFGRIIRGKGIVRIAGLKLNPALLQHRKSIMKFQSAQKSE
jgi:hypothetical protein